jgi:hypothetical protein
MKRKLHKIIKEITNKAGAGRRAYFSYIYS